MTHKVFNSEQEKSTAHSSKGMFYKANGLVINGGNYQVVGGGVYNYVNSMHKERCGNTENLTSMNSNNSSVRVSGVREGTDTIRLSEATEEISLQERRILFAEAALRRISGKPPKDPIAESHTSTTTFSSTPSSTEDGSSSSDSDSESDAEADEEWARTSANSRSQVLNGFQRVKTALKEAGAHTKHRHMNPFIEMRFGAQKEIPIGSETRVQPNAQWESDQKTWESTYEADSD
ncbi:hypothetical protein C0991_002164 [Blastosporella zonata]|nr:hypothetical protein C0991_002164 [Blastosporella zonata]